MEMKQAESQIKFPADFERKPVLPERYIEDRVLSDFSVLESAFQQALTAFQNCFVDQMLNLERAYMTKLKHLQDQRHKLHTNHAFAQQYFEQAHTRIRGFRETILAEKVEWERERAVLEQELKGSFANKNRLISLDVGGTHRITTNLDLLTAVKGSLLSKMFSGRHDVPKNAKGNVFLDRDGETFLTLVNYLRNYRRALPKLDSVK